MYQNQNAPTEGRKEILVLLIYVQLIFVKIMIVKKKLYVAQKSLLNLTVPVKRDISKMYFTLIDGINGNILFDS